MPGSSSTCLRALAALKSYTYKFHECFCMAHPGSGVLGEAGKKQWSPSREGLSLRGAWTRCCEYNEAWSPFSGENKHSVLRSPGQWGTSPSGGGAEFFHCSFFFTCLHPQSTDHILGFQKLSSWVPRPRFFGHAAWLMGS